MNISFTEQSTRQLKSDKLISQREFLSYCFIICFILFGIMTVGLFGWISIPKTEHIFVIGNISDFPPNLHPYPIHFNDERIWLVNTGLEIFALSGRTPHPKRIPLIWASSIQHFVDPI